jgi:hypothetical protein
MAEEAESKISASEKKKEDWMNSKWRPMMGWMYMGVCSFDFVLAPVMWSLLQSLSHGSVQTQWQPLTLQGAGLFHIAMGAVLGIAAHGRTQEKLNGANNGGLSQPGLGTTYVPPNANTNVNMNLGNQPSMGGASNGGFGSSGGFGTATTPAPTTNSFGSQTSGSGFGSTASTGGFGAGTTGSNGFDTTVAATTPLVNAKGQKVVPPTDFPPI